MDLWNKLIQAISFSVATPEGRQRLEPLDFALRVAVLVTIIAVVIDTMGLYILSKFGLVTDLANGLMLGTTLSATIAFTLAFLICWINASEVKVLAQSHERFLHLSHTDALTGLNNRLGLYANCVKLDTQYCVAFFDIDHFKSVNDRYGHLAGDLVISSVAAIIRDSFDDTAHVSRLGGEEFVVVQALAPQHFLEVCERVRAKIAVIPMDFQDVRINTTVSVGVAFRANWEIFEKVLHNADMALYEAKRTGRNRVCLAGHKVSRQSVA
ncbi:GGDEF domain-containing protein [Agrobacterium arsenijevicii]|uniref:diguanylate cyclase n=1 Tax=Agrobacterium arsenijevicii TaxID=1585697 RepID=A0ABR5DAE1_9HYPH|nr:diguanylate cyclase [Agrobacterium arsenijevicii]